MNSSALLVKPEMNRRNFIGSLVVAGASFSILPGAGRLWRVQRQRINLNKLVEKSIYELLIELTQSVPAPIAPGELDLIFKQAAKQKAREYLQVPYLL